MNIKEFCIKNELENKKEIDRVAYLAFFIQTIENKNSFSIKEISDILTNNNLCNPNISRMRINIKRDRRFINKGENFALNQKGHSQICKNCVIEDFDTINSSSEFIDEDLFKDCPTYMKKLVKQVNCSYVNNLFDATAVIIRRIFEVLLIKSYMKSGITDEIKSNGDFLSLEKIISNAVQNKILSLSRSKKDLDSIREVGNFSAHKLEYNANKNDLEKIKANYRGIIEELLYKSGLKI